MHAIVRAIGLLLLLSPLAADASPQAVDDLAVASIGRDATLALEPTRPTARVPGVEIILPTVLVANTTAVERVHPCTGAIVPDPGAAPATTDIGGQPGFAIEFVASVESLSPTRRRWTFLWRPDGGFDGSRSLVDPDSLAGGQPPTQLQLRFGAGTSAGCAGDLSLFVGAPYEVIGIGVLVEVLGTGGDIIGFGSVSVQAPSPTTAAAAAGINLTSIALETIGGGRMTFTLDTNFGPELTILSPPDPTLVEEGTPIDFTGTASDPEDGDLTGSIAWHSDLAGPIGTGGAFTTTLDPGLHVVAARVTDSGGRTAEDEVTILVTVNQPPEVIIVSPPDGITFTAGETIHFVGGAIDPEDGPLVDAVTWTSSLEGLIGIGDMVTGTLGAGSHLISASATDSGGLTTTETVTITVDAPPTIGISSPTDGQAFLAGTAVGLVADASDLEDGDLSASIAWWSSLDGFLGTGGVLSVPLSTGLHQLTAEVTDSHGTIATDTVTISVAAAALDGLDEDFEGAADGWIATGLWHRVADSDCPPAGENGYSSPVHAFYYGQDATCDYNTGSATAGTLTSPLIGGLGTASTLRFQFLREVEFAVGTWDRTLVQVLQDGILTSVFELDASTPSAGTWLDSGEVDLSAFAGEVIQIRFVFDTIDEISNSFIGWFVDDVRVTANAPPDVIITAPAGGTAVVEATPIDFAATALDLEDGDLTAELAWSSDIDGAIGMGGAITATLSVGVHTVTASVADSSGAVGSDAIAATVTANTPPAVTITAPADGTTTFEGVAVDFAATAFDLEDGDLTAELAWTSDIDGLLGTGGSFSATLSVGIHLITTEVTDSHGAAGAASHTVTVEPDLPPEVTILQPTSGAVLLAGLPTTFAGTAVDAVDGDLGAELAWRSDLDGALGIGPEVLAALSAGRHTITAEVVDSTGASGSDSVTVTVVPVLFADGFESGDTSAWSDVLPGGSASVPTGTAVPTATAGPAGTAVPETEQGIDLVREPWRLLGLPAPRTREPDPSRRDP